MRNQTLFCSRFTVTDSSKNIHQRYQYKMISAFSCFTVQSVALARTLVAINVTQKDDDDDDEEGKKNLQSLSKQTC